MEMLSTFKDLVTIVAGATAVVTLIIGILEYRRNLILSRIDHISKVQQLWLTDQVLSNIATLLDTRTDDPQLAELPEKEKRQFICFLERIDLLRQAKLITPQLARYMFGNYAILCSDSRTFWSSSFSHKDWRLFSQFVGEMKKTATGADSVKGLHA